MSQDEETLCDGEGLELTLRRLARDIIEGRRPNTPLRLVGVRSRGVPIAERLAAILAASVETPVPVGAIDITLYRDDLGQGDRWPVLHGTEIDFEVDGVEIILVDDVLFTGRTTRAALNVICDLGRPARVRLLTVVDRGHRELPIQPDFAGMVVRTARDDHVHVRVKPFDEVDEVVMVRSPGSPPRRV
jgi:pyrimidine operon attenuation protein / uracil phosphoribosyltransferase